MRPSPNPHVYVHRTCIPRGEGGGGGGGEEAAMEGRYGKYEVLEVWRV